MGRARCSISSHGRGLVVASDGAGRRPPLGLASGYGGQSESRPGGAEQGRRDGSHGGVGEVVVQQRGGAAAWGARCSISSHGRRLVGEKIGENLHERIRLWWKMRWAPPCAVRLLLLRRNA
jgi:hypothetical protein